MKPELVLIAAVARNGVIGAGNRLLWQLPEDMRFFKQATLGHAVIMGRKTWDSLPSRFRPLPGRRNLVVTRNAAFAAPGAECVTSLPGAITLLLGTGRAAPVTWPREGASATAGDLARRGGSGVGGHRLGDRSHW